VVNLLQTRLGDFLGGIKNPATHRDMTIDEKIEKKNVVLNKITRYKKWKNLIPNHP
jgi:hypothetical protein